jgi:hypothetical protein
MTIETWVILHTVIDNKTLKMPLFSEFHYPTKLLLAFEIKIQLMEFTTVTLIKRGKDTFSGLPIRSVVFHGILDTFLRLFNKFYTLNNVFQ